MFSGRASSLFAALSMVVGVRFLDKPARAILRAQKGTWLDLEIPENLSYECAKLLLSLPPDVTLTEEEKKVYGGMRRYRLIELNIQSKLTATVPWTPEKTSGIGDRQLQCKNCDKKRSVTIMAEGSICGFCALEQDRLDTIARHVKGAKDIPSINVKEEPEISEDKVKWVECCVPTCRAQYVVLNPHLLNVRPKCHYCRNDRSCPFVVCTTCDNRVIVPEEYRTAAVQEFTCHACQSGKKTVVEVETNLRSLMEENGHDWIGFDPKLDLFHNQSAFKIFSKYGTEAFTGTPIEKPLTLCHKKIFNVQAIRYKIEGRVETGEVEKGTCSLCFDDVHYHKLLPACGRSGCKQRADDECLKRWYGENKAGNLLNPLQLRCPFCRRTPTHKTLIKYNEPALSVGDLAPAIADRAWYYAWCLTCGSAKPAVERACADNGLPAINDFICEQCTTERAELEARLRAEAEELRRRGEAARLAEVDRRLQVVKGSAVIKIMPCPGCGVYVEKSYGCNHITCQCGAHFCFVCGKRFSSETIYRHLEQMHGGIGIGDDDEEEYNTDDEY